MKSFTRCWAAILCLAAVSQWALAEESSCPKTRFECYCPETITNSHECYLYRESQLAEKYGKHFYRNGKTQNIHVHLTNGKVKILKDVPEIYGVEVDSYSHVLVGYYLDVNYWLVAIQYVEGSSYELLDGKNGKTTTVGGEALLSPDKARFVVANFDINAGWSPNILSVWRIEGEGLIREFSVEPDGWGATEMVWKNPSTVKFLKTFLPFEHDEYATEAKRLVGRPASKGKGKLWKIQ
ncbi:MAG: hypothetical protein LBE81_05590 [Azonexus sp.]|jgi:hypothetical protein|nr:hypothetical protein [Azonexus sp.]